jgi:glycine/D-amino acid oxidase-like deaminating enzyme
VAAPDVLVIGGGIVGTSTAYHLARRGVSVTLVDGEHVGWGASGRNLGLVWMHTRRPGPELDLVWPTRRSIEEMPGELDADFGLQTGGSLIVFEREDQVPVFQEFVDARQGLALDVRLISGDDARAMMPMLPDSVIGASYCANDAQIDPGRYSPAYAKAARRLGVTINEGVRVERLEAADGRVTGAVTTAGLVDAGSVVLAAGVWSPALAATVGVDLPIRPMRLQVIRTEPLPGHRLGHVYYGAMAVKQYTIFKQLPSFRPELFASDLEERHGLPLLESASQHEDGSFLLGLPMDYPGLDQSVTLDGLALTAGRFAQALPALRGARFARAWAGLLPYTADNLPLIGPAPGMDGLFVAAGHVFGNAAGPTTGRLIADLLTGEPPVIDPTSVRVDRPGLAFAEEVSTW